MNVIFSIYIDVDDADLDNPARFRMNGDQEVSSKSKNTKEQFKKYWELLTYRQRQYANKINADYYLYKADSKFENFKNWFTKNIPEMSQFDIICFYRHHIMDELAKNYHGVLYLDLDIVPYSNENIFEIFDLDCITVADSTNKSRYGRSIEPRFFNSCIRDPSTKWFNAKALLEEKGLSVDDNVYNTGIMLAGSNAIRHLNFFDNFKDGISLMKRVKEDNNYPYQISRVFGFDTETYFSLRVNETASKVGFFDKDWHCTSLSDRRLRTAKFVHVISKEFEKIL